MVVCTSTASGKSLCYAIPILEALVKDPGACAMLMFPTKALAQDQLRALRALCAAALGPAGPRVEVYDGDTPQVRTVCDSTSAGKYFGSCSCTAL